MDDATFESSHHNRSIFDHHAFVNYRKDGVYTFQLDQVAINSMKKDLQNSFDESQGTLQVGRYHFGGYDQYYRVDTVKFKKQQQRRSTTLIPGNRIPYLAQNVQGFSNVVKRCQQEYPSYSILSCHILRQDDPHAVFTWHRDTELGVNHLISIVILLKGENRTAMQVAGFEPIYYQHIGQAFAFPSDAVHRTYGGAGEGILKIAFFMGVRDLQITDTIRWNANDTSWIGCFCSQSRNNAICNKWVSCDVCHRWCHSICTGLTISQLKKISYTCPTCESRKHSCFCKRLIHVKEHVWLPDKVCKKWIKCSVPLCMRYHHSTCCNGKDIKCPDNGCYLRDP